MRRRRVRRGKRGSGAECDADAGDREAWVSPAAKLAVVAAEAADARWPHYAVDASSLDRLLVRVELPSKLIGALRVAEGAERFVANAQVRTAKGVWPLDRDGQSFVTAHWRWAQLGPRATSW